MKSIFKFVKLEKATDNKHKWVMTLFNTKTNKMNNIKFGAKGYDDFTTFDKKIRDEKKRLYQIRHQNDNLEKENSPGALSMFILWNKGTVEESLKDYLKYFGIEKY
jgi:uncharacterized protein YeeX (DUF496 family)